METGECKDVMMSYLSCIKRVKGMNDPECRLQAKEYLSCRMERCVYIHLPRFGQIGQGEIEDGREGRSLNWMRWWADSVEQKFDGEGRI